MHNAIFNSMMELGSLIGEQFMGLKNLEVKCQIDKRCWECNGHSQAPKYVDMQDELADDPDLIHKLPKKELVECSHCKGSGVIENHILITASVEKKPGVKTENKKK